MPTLWRLSRPSPLRRRLAGMERRPEPGASAFARERGAGQYRLLYPGFGAVLEQSTCHRRAALARGSSSDPTGSAPGLVRALPGQPRPRGALTCGVSAAGRFPMTAGACSPSPRCWRLLPTAGHLRGGLGGRGGVRLCRLPPPRSRPRGPAGTARPSPPTGSPCIGPPATRLLLGPVACRGHGRRRPVHARLSWLDDAAARPAGVLATRAAGGGHPRPGARLRRPLPMPGGVGLHAWAGLAARPWSPARLLSRPGLPDLAPRSR